MELEELIKKEKGDDADKIINDHLINKANRFLGYLKEGKFHSGL